MNKGKIFAVNCGFLIVLAVITIIYTVRKNRDFKLESILFKSKIHNLVLINDSLEKALNELKMYYIFDCVQVLVLPEKSVINLGEEFSADIILNYCRSDELSYTSKPITIISDGRDENGNLSGTTDTVQTIDGVGKINIKPDVRGKKEIFGKYLCENYGKKLELDFSIVVDVK